MGLIDRLKNHGLGPDGRGYKTANPTDDELATLEAQASESAANVIHRDASQRRAAVVTKAIEAGLPYVTNEAVTTGEIPQIPKDTERPKKH